MEKGRSSVWTGGQRRVWWKEYGYGQIGVFWLMQRRKKGRKEGRRQTMINILLQRPSDNRLATTPTPNLLFKGTDQKGHSTNELRCHASRVSSLSCELLRVYLAVMLRRRNSRPCSVPLTSQGDLRIIL